MDHEDDNDPNWRVRVTGSHFNPQLAYVNDNDLFTLEVHHGGELISNPEVRYQGGRISYVDKVNADYFSIIIMNDMMLELGYDENELDDLRYHFRVPGEDMEFGLMPLSNDSDVLKLIKHALRAKVVDVYVENLHQAGCFDANAHVGDLTQDHEHVVEVQQVHRSDPDLGDLTQVDDMVMYTADQVPLAIENPINIPNFDGGDGGSSEGGDGEDNEDSDNSDDNDKDDEDGYEKTDSENESDSGTDNSEDSDYKADEEPDSEDSKEEGGGKTVRKRVNDDPDFIFDVEDFVVDYDADMEEYRAAVEFDASGDENLEDEADVDEELTGDVQVDLDDFNSLSDDDDTKLERAVRRTRRMNKRGGATSDSPFYVGQQWVDREAIKEVVKKHAIETRRQLYILKNDSTRFRVVCLGVNPTLSSIKTPAAGPEVGGSSGTSLGDVGGNSGISSVGVNTPAAGSELGGSSGISLGELGGFNYFCFCL